jgi:hypothetical protein
MNTVRTTFSIETGSRATTRLALFGMVLGVLVLLPAFASRGLVQDMIFVFYMLALAQCWNLLAGYAGLVSVGQQAFVGLGGYLLFAFTIFLDLDPLLAILLAGIVSAASRRSIGSWRPNSSSWAAAPERPSPRRRPTRSSASNGSSGCSTRVRLRRAT